MAPAALASAHCHGKQLLRIQNADRATAIRYHAKYHRISCVWRLQIIRSDIDYFVNLLHCERDLFIAAQRDNFAIFGWLSSNERACAEHRKHPTAQTNNAQHAGGRIRQRRRYAPIRYRFDLVGEYSEAVGVGEHNAHTTRGLPQVPWISFRSIRHLLDNRLHRRL